MKACLWGIVPRDKFSRMEIIAEFGRFCDDEWIKPVPTKINEEEVSILIVKDIFINHLLKMGYENVHFDTYVKIGDFDWREVREMKK